MSEEQKFHHFLDREPWTTEMEMFGTNILKTTIFDKESKENTRYEIVLSSPFRDVQNTFPNNCKTKGRQVSSGSQTKRKNKQRKKASSLSKK